MNYDDLVTAIAEASGLDKADVRSVMNALPEFLGQMDEGEKVRTPLGVFRAMVRKARQVKDLNGEGMVDVPAELVIKLKPSVRLKRTPDDSDDEG